MSKKKSKKQKREAEPCEYCLQYSKDFVACKHCQHVLCAKCLIDLGHGAVCCDCFAEEINLHFVIDRGVWYAKG